MTLPSKITNLFVNILHFFVTAMLSEYNTYVLIPPCLFECTVRVLGACALIKEYSFSIQSRRIIEWFELFGTFKII